MSTIDKAANSLLEGKEKIVVFSVPDVSKKEILSKKPVIKGEVKLFIDYWRVDPYPAYAKTKDGEERVFSNPAWKDIINACNDILKMGDRCGVFLEGILTHDNMGEDGKIKHVELLIGS